MNAIIGYTGFVGSNIIEKMKFDFMYNSKNINQISDYNYDLIISAAMPSLKWYANKYPEEDLFDIVRFTNNLLDVDCDKFILISTFDIYEKINNNSRLIKCNESHFPYGWNRYYMEIKLKKLFGDRLTIIRLPGLFGNNLKKNVLFDLINNKFFNKLNLCDTYQFYDLRDLASDIKYILDNDIKEINLSSEPIKIKEIVETFFQIDTDIMYENCNTATIYDLHTRLEGRDYWNTKEDIMNKLKNFLSK